MYVCGMCGPRSVFLRPDDTPWEGGTFKLTITFTEVRPDCEEDECVPVVDVRITVTVVGLPEQGADSALFNEALPSKRVRGRSDLFGYSAEPVEPNL